MFDRDDGNKQVSYRGATVFDKKNGGKYIGDLEYEILSYIRVENHPVTPLAPPRSKVLYFPDSHRITSAMMDMDIETTSISKEAPLLAFPVEYVHGPVNLKGRMYGKPVEGIGSFERTFALYRDFELARVLLDSMKALPESAFRSGPESRSVMVRQAGELQDYIASGNDHSARSLLEGELKLSASSLSEGDSVVINQLLQDISSVL
jgi:hypothetical protein